MRIRRMETYKKLNVFSERWWWIGIYIGREGFKKKEEEWIWTIGEYGEGIMDNQ